MLLGGVQSGARSAPASFPQQMRQFPRRRIQESLSKLIFLKKDVWRISLFQSDAFRSTVQVYVQFFPPFPKIEVIVLPCRGCLP